MSRKSERNYLWQNPGHVWVVIVFDVRDTEQSYGAPVVLHIGPVALERGRLQYELGVQLRPVRKRYSAQLWEILLGVKGTRTILG